MADDRWEWDAPSRRYRDTTTGRYLSAASSRKLRDDLVTRLGQENQGLARKLASGDLTLPAWEKAMQTQVRDAHTVQWAFGRGGRNAMTEHDLTDLNGLVRGQWGYLRGFTEAIAGGTLSEAQVSARAALYTSASVQAYERGRAAAWDVILPAHPGDGSTACKSNCRCFWRLTEKADGSEVHATWTLGGAEHCADCKSRARRWAPLVIARPVEDRLVHLLRPVA